MSMVGTSLLNEIVNEKGITGAATILNMLRDRLISTLQQTGAEDESKDGMDIALCVVDGNRLEYAGANNPLYMIRSAQLSEVKGDKHPVSIHLGTDHNFKGHELNLSQGDCVYLLSDGFADQFGGQSNKKFMYKKLKELLLSIASLGMNEQKKNLSDAFYAWKGTCDQVDDVLIIGIRF
jgi:serine phosphatase RsbU (regulator of sigma subunit)